MWRPTQAGVDFAGVAGCGCGCTGGGFGAAPRHFPAIEHALRSYVADKTATGQYFYISPQLNTAALAQGHGFGGMGASFLDTGLSVDPTSSDPITAAANDIGSVFSSFWGGSPSAASDPGLTLDPSGITGNWTQDLQDIAAQTGSQITLSLPSDARPQVAAAAKTDLFGAPLSPLIIGASAVGVLVLALVLSKPSSRRRRR